MEAGAEVAAALVAVVVALAQHPAMAGAVAMEPQLLLDMAVLGAATAMDVSSYSQPCGFMLLDTCAPLFSAAVSAAQFSQGFVASCCSVKLLL